jgi:phage portal protein BeeE
VRVKSWLFPGGRGRKSWSGEPPVWAADALTWPWTSAQLPDRERIENHFEGYVQGAYKGDSVVFSAIDRRQQVFSQARFQWREFRNGRPGDLFGSAELDLLEHPWPNGTTGELLARMEQDASLAGQFYGCVVDEAGKIGRSATGPGRRIVRMRPDWTSIVIDAPSGNPFGLDARVVAYLYEPSTSTAGWSEPVTLLTSEVCHYSPKPDPTARFRGMSWLTPVLQEILADKAATRHKLKFYDNGASPNMAIKFDKDTRPEAFELFVQKFNDAHRGVENAYKTMFLAGGADVVPLSMDFKQLDFKVTQGAGENRIAVAAGVPAAILGISEGLQGSSLNAGNFGAARRLFVDSTIRDLWSKAAPSLQVLVTPPRSGASLWYDDRDIPFLREDEKDLAEIQFLEAQTLRQLLDAGWEPDSAKAYLQSGDLGALRHSGLFSVQLQPAGQQSGQQAADSGQMPTLGDTGTGKSVNGSAYGALTR